MKRQHIRRLVPVFLLILFVAESNADAQIRAANGKEITRSEMDRFLQHAMDSLGMPGLSIAIITNGKICYERALGVTNMSTGKKVDRNSIFEAASLSKPVFAFFVMKMVENGELDLDKPLYQYLPYADIAYDDRYKLITARMVLTHTSGLPNSRYYDKADTGMHIKNGDLYLKFTPGTNFSYSGEGFLYLSMVIAHLNHRTLQDLDELFQQEVAIPLGMKHAYFAWNDFLADHKVTGHNQGKVTNKGWPVSLRTHDSSWFGSMGGLHTEAIDYARFVIGIMEYKDLKKEYVDEMLKAQYHFARGENGLYVYNNDSAYGLSLGIKASKHGPYFSHGGNNWDFQSGCEFSMEKKNGYVFFTNCDKGSLFFEKLAIYLGW